MIYVVFDSVSEPYESQNIWACFDSREKAENFVKENHGDMYEAKYYIEELRLNGTTDQFKWYFDRYRKKEGQ